MTMNGFIRASIVLLLFCTAGVAAQTDQTANQTVPVYRVTVVGRTVKAINYKPLSGSTKIDFRGTSLMTSAYGKAAVSGRKGVFYVHAEFQGLGSPTQFGPEYLTYVLWAITPDGHPSSVAEIVPHDGKAVLDVTVDLQAFGLIVTAEPYFAVRMPSDVVVMQNEVTRSTQGKIEEIDAKYELLGRGGYTQTVNRSELQPEEMSPKTPLALYEAENAVKIARWAGADRYGGDTFNKAEQLLKEAQDDQAHKANSKTVIMAAREAVQTAEDARTIALRVEQQQEEAQEQQAVAAAKVKAEQDAAAKAQAEAAQAQAEAARERAQAQAEQAQQQAEAQAEQAQVQAQEAQRRIQEANQKAQQAEEQRTEMRNRLLQQLNAILQTRQSSRGLVVTMSHVFFDTGKSNLHEGNQQTLAKLSGVLLAYPGVKVEVDGYTDNTGSPEVNDELSQKRADAVQEFLIQQGLPAGAVTARGLGESNPVAPNDTAMDRALNRRVEIVISGDAIGIPVTSATR